MIGYQTNSNGADWQYMGPLLGKNLQVVEAGKAFSSVNFTRLHCTLSEKINIFINF